MLNNGTIRFWTAGNVRQTLSFTPPPLRSPTVVTFQLEQSGTSVVGTVISGASNTAVETVFPNVTIQENPNATFYIGNGTYVDITTHSLHMSPGALTKTSLETLHSDTKALWGLA